MGWDEIVLIGLSALGWYTLLSLLVRGARRLVRRIEKRGADKRAAFEARAVGLDSALARQVAALLIEAATAVEARKPDTAV